MNQAELSRSMQQALLVALSAGTLCDCKACQADANDALMRLAETDDPAKLSQAQQGVVAMALESLRARSDEAPPRAAFAEIMAALGYVPAVSSDDVLLMMTAVRLYGKANPDIEVPTAEQVTRDLLRPIPLEIAARMGGMIEAAALAFPDHPKVARLRNFALRLCVPILDVPAAINGAEPHAMPRSVSDLMVRVRDAAAAGEIAGLSAGAQSYLSEYGALCRKLEQQMPGVGPVLDKGSVGPLTEAVQLYQGEADEEARGQLLEFLAALPLSSNGAAATA